MNLQMAAFCIVSLMLGHNFMSSLYNPLFHQNFRRSHPEVFCKKVVHRNFAKFTGKHLCQSCRPHELYWLWLNFIRLIVIFTQCDIFRNIYDALRDLLPFLQFKKREKHPWRVVTFSNFTKINTPLWVFFTFFKLDK